MLTKKEIRLTKTYYLLTKFIVPSFLMCFVTLPIWLVLIFVQDFVFQGGLVSSAGIYLMIGCVAFYLVVFSYSTLRTRFGCMGKQWKTIMRKAYIQDQHIDLDNAGLDVAALNAMGNLTDQEVFNVLAAEKAHSVLSRFAGQLSIQIKLVMDLFNIEFRTKKFVVALVLVPQIVLVGAYVPQILDARDALNERISNLTQVTAEIAEPFEANEFEVRVDNLENDLHYYSVDIYPESESESESGSGADANPDADPRSDDYRLHLQLFPDGRLNEVSYFMDTVPGGSPRESFAVLKKAIARTQPLLMSVKCFGQEDVLAALDKLDEGVVFVGEGFAGSAGDKDFYVNQVFQGRECSFSYHVEGNYADGPYVYFAMKVLE